MFRIALYQADIFLLLLLFVHNGKKGCKTDNRIQGGTYLVVHVGNQCRLQPVCFFRPFLGGCQLFFQGLPFGNRHQRTFYRQQLAIPVVLTGDGMHLQPLQHQSFFLFGPETKFDNYFLDFAIQQFATGPDHTEAIFLVYALVNTRNRNREQVIMNNLPPFGIVRRTGIKPDHTFRQFPFPWENLCNPKCHQQLAVHFIQHLLSPQQFGLFFLFHLCVIY